MYLNDKRNELIYNIKEYLELKPEIYKNEYLKDAFIKQLDEKNPAIIFAGKKFTYSQTLEASDENKFEELWREFKEDFFAKGGIVYGSHILNAEEANDLIKKMNSIEDVLLKDPDYVRIKEENKDRCFGEDYW